MVRRTQIPFFRDCGANIEMGLSLLPSIVGMSTSRSQQADGVNQNPPPIIGQVYPLRLYVGP